jgi:transcriptional adapter 2-alpha
VVSPLTLLYVVVLIRRNDAQEQHSVPIFTEDWGADEELLMITGLVNNGLGNWAEVAGYVGTRNKEECEKHYVEVFLGGYEDTVTEKEDQGVQEISLDEDMSKKRKREFMPVRDLPLG